MGSTELTTAVGRLGLSECVQSALEWREKMRRIIMRL